MNPMSESPTVATRKATLSALTASFSDQPLQVDVCTGGVTLSHGGETVLGLAAVASTKNTLMYHPPVQEQGKNREADLILAGLEGWLASYPTHLCVDIQVAQTTPGLAFLHAAGLLQRTGHHHYRCHGAVLWQHAPLWLPTERAPYPQLHVNTAGMRHPLRPPQPHTTFYRRFIPWLGQTLTLAPVDLSRDLDAFNRWMNTPRVARFWNETGSRDEHRRYLEQQLSSAHSFPVIGRFDGVPFGYFEIYWAREDRIAPYYDAGDYDRGLHLLVGEESYRGQAFYTAWFSSLCHFAFLDDARTQQVVCEPSFDNRRQLSNFDRSGFARIKSFDFPHKRATLVTLSREQFFHEHLFHPLAAPRGARPFSRS